LKQEAILKVLKTVPKEEAFYFFTSTENYNGKSASSLKEFMEKINEVNVKSLEFHLYRGDFEKWISEVLQDAELTEEVKKLQKFNLTGEVLRNRLYTIVSRHLERLTSQLSSRASQLEK